VTPELNYCQRCGRALADVTVDGKPRRGCPGCGLVVFLDPKIAAAVLALVGDKLVMIKRGVEPAIGRWSFPSGFVDRGEAVEHAAVREVREETGLDVTLAGLVGLYSWAGSPTVLAVYAAEVAGGELKAGHDALEAALFHPDELPPLSFPHDEQIIKDWQALRGP
jgi:ADP-ribose pyrophosphatase YjhB (NUDIX family)